MNTTGCECCGEPIHLVRGYGYSHVDTTLNVGCNARPKPSHPSVPKIVEAVEKDFDLPSWNQIELQIDLGSEPAEPKPTLTSIPAQTFEEYWKVFNKSEYARAALGIGTEKAPYGSSEYFLLRRCAEATWNAAKGSE